MGDLPSALKRNTGAFTLVEAIVAGAIGIFLGAIMIVMFQLNNRAVADGALSSKIEMLYQTVVDQIGSTARRANMVLADGEPWASTVHGAVTSVKKIVMYDRFGNMIGGYEVAGSSLKERVGGTWQVFRVGADTIAVDDTSTFILSEDRKSLVLNISVICSYRTTRDTAISKQEMYLCRN
jgi:hypothetical protein